MCVVRLLIKISTVAMTAAQFCVWTHYSWDRPRSQYNICFPHELNIVLEGCWDLRTRLEYYTPSKKVCILQSKGTHFKKICRRTMRGEIIFHFFLAVFCTAQHGLHTSNLLPTLIQYITCNPQTEHHDTSAYNPLKTQHTTIPCCMVYNGISWDIQSYYI